MYAIRSYYGEILIEQYGVTPESIEEALVIQRERGGRIGEILVQQRKISEDDLLGARGKQCGLDVVYHLPPEPDPFFIDRVPIGFLKKFKMIPVALPDCSYIALAEPTNFQQLDDLQHLLQWEA